MSSSAAFLTIVCMALATYLTRVLGYLVFRNRELGQRARGLLEAAPGCVMVSAIAPYFASKDANVLIATAVAVICAMRLSMLPTMVIAVGTLGLLRSGII
jgi:uncharacterized membrane protein